jgi:hypothetical protein
MVFVWLSHTRFQLEYHFLPSSSFEDPFEGSVLSVILFHITMFISSKSLVTCTLYLFIHLFLVCDGKLVRMPVVFIIVFLKLSMVQGI